MEGVSRGRKVPEQVVTSKTGIGDQGGRGGGGDRPEFSSGWRTAAAHTDARRQGSNTERCMPPNRTDSAVQQVPSVVHNVALGFHKAEKPGGARNGGDELLS